MNFHITHDHSVIVGDFNADLLVSTYDSKQIFTLSNSRNLFLVLFGPTHHVRNSDTLFDLCILDDKSKLAHYEQQDMSFLSAHDLISITYMIKHDHNFQKTVVTRDFRNFDENRFFGDLSTLNWDTVYNAKLIDTKVENFNKILLECFNLHAPVCSFIPKKLPAPWIIDELRRTMSDRDEARRRWRRHRSSVNHMCFKKLRNKTQVAVREANITSKHSTII